MAFKETRSEISSEPPYAQNDCPDVFFKLGESTRKIERIKETDSVKILGNMAGY